MRLIDADALTDTFKRALKHRELYAEWELYDTIDCAPTIDAVKHGKWEEKETHLNEGDCEITEWQSARCSKCGKYHTTPYMYYFDNFNFCPNCGTKMDKE